MQCMLGQTARGAAVSGTTKKRRNLCLIADVDYSASSDEDFRLEVETSRYINVLVVLYEF